MQHSSLEGSTSRARTSSQCANPSSYTMHNDSRSDAICFLMPLLWTLITPATLHALCQVYPHGSTDALPFVTMGSGSLNAMSVFESGYKEDMTKEEAMELVGQCTPP